jgi:acyl-CoA synthetase (AMP-forming)/AMP-acid ligase II
MISLAETRPRAPAQKLPSSIATSDAEVEAAILRDESVRSWAVAGLAGEDLGQRPRAVVESEDETLDLNALRLFLTKHLSRDRHPRSLERITSPVRDGAGKLRKASLGKDPT